MGFHIGRILTGFDSGNHDFKHSLFVPLLGFLLEKVRQHLEALGLQVPQGLLLSSYGLIGLALWCAHSLSIFGIPLDTMGTGWEDLAGVCSVTLGASQALPPLSMARFWFARCVLFGSVLLIKVGYVMVNEG